MHHSLRPVMKKRRPIPDPPGTPPPSPNVRIHKDGITFRSRIFPEERKFRDESVPLDQLLSSLFYELRQSRAEKAMFFAAAIDRMGYGEGLWKNLMIFSFREINYGYPEASIYVYDYYCNWLEEMRRHREELSCRLRFACSHALMARFPDLCERLASGVDDRAESLRSFLTTHLSEEERTELLDDIRTLMSSVEATEAYPSFEHPCSCTMRKDQMMGDTTEYEDEREEALFSEMRMSEHLTTARHLLFSVVNYLCVLPKTSLALDVSFYTAYRSLGHLIPEDWDIRLSFSELDYALFKVRKDREEAVQQVCICLCAAILHQDEDRAMRMADLFHVWEEVPLFWRCLDLLCQVFRDHYAWILPYVQKYREAWRVSDDCRDYFVEGCRSALFAAVLLFIRGKPQRDVNIGRRKTGNNLVLMPSHIQYKSNYVKIIYGSQTPSFEDLSFLSEHSPCPTTLWTPEGAGTVRSPIDAFARSPIDEVYDGFRREWYLDPETSTAELMQDPEICRLVHMLVPTLVRHYPGNVSSGREPYARQCPSTSKVHVANTSFRRMLVNSSRKEKERNGNLRIRREELEVPIDRNAVDWSTQKGRDEGRGCRHTFLVSQGYSPDHSAQVNNKYYEKNETYIRSQEKTANRLRRQPIPDNPFDVETVELVKLVNQAEELSRMFWYDPGIVIQYRKVISDVYAIEVAWATEKPTLPKVNRSEFALNTINVEAGKGEISTRVLGRDDILRRLDQLEDLGASASSFGAAGEDDEESSSSLMEDMCARTSSLTLSRGSLGLSQGTLGSSRKRSHEAMDEPSESADSMSLGSMGVGSCADDLTMSMGEVEEMREPSGEGRPHPSNVFYQDALFSGPMEGEDSKVYLVLEPVTRSLYALISMGPFPSEEAMRRFVADMDVRESLDLANVYKELLNGWAQVGYQGFQRFIREEMDPATGESGSEEPEDEETLDGILSTMDAVHRERKTKIPAGYRKASEFVFEQHPFYPDCVRSNSTARFGRKVEDVPLFHRSMVPGNLLHLSMKVCNLPINALKNLDGFRASIDRAVEENDFARSLQFVSADNPWWSRTEVAQSMAYKMVECALYSYMLRSIEDFSTPDFIDSLVYTYITDGDDVSLFVGSAPVYLGYLATDRGEVAESPEWDAFFELFDAVVRSMEDYLPPQVFTTQCELLFCENGRQWVTDVLSYWRSILENYQSETKDAFTVQEDALRCMVSRFSGLPIADQPLS